MPGECDFFQLRNSIEGDVASKTESKKLNNVEFYVFSEQTLYKCHKMPLMSHSNKNDDQRLLLSLRDTWIKNLNITGIKDNQMSCDIIKTDLCYLPSSQFKVLNFEACG